MSVATLSCDCGRQFPPGTLAQARTLGKTKLGCKVCGVVTDLRPHFDGPDYDPAYDKDRLTKQIGRVFDAMRDGNWRTVPEIAQIIGDPENSISAQLRHLRKPRFGAYTMEKRHRGDRSKALYEYRLLDPSGNVIGL